MTFTGPTQEGGMVRASMGMGIKSMLQTQTPIMDPNYNFACVQVYLLCMICNIERRINA